MNNKLYPNPIDFMLLCHDLFQDEQRILQALKRFARAHPDLIDEPERIHAQSKRMHYIFWSNYTAGRSPLDVLKMIALGMIPVRQIGEKSRLKIAEAIKFAESGN